MSISYGVKSIEKKNGYQVIDSLYLSSAVLVDGNDQGNQFENYKKYRLVSNEVDFYWGRKGFETVTLLISYKGTELIKFENPTFQLVIDYLNKFDSIPQKEIEELAKVAQEESKTQLELEIKTLQANKDKLLEQIAILKQIVEKEEEIKLLLDKLND